LATLIASTVGFTGSIEFDTSKPDGMPVKRLDVSRLHALGWQAKIDFARGLADTYEWFLSQSHIRGVS
jgi:GDP-L-fucose synthase